MWFLRAWIEWWEAVFRMPETRRLIVVRKEDKVIYVRAAVHRSSA